MYDSNATVPRAVIHKKILDVAKSRPDASMEEIADVVNGATTSIVEHVLEEYGDPGTPPEESNDGDSEEKPDYGSGGADSVESGLDEDASTMREHEDGADPSLDLTLEPADVTEKQLETLREIYKRPDATQAELADILGVSSATINQRVNAIDEFDWSKRHQFVDALFENGTGFSVDGMTADEPIDSGPKSRTVLDEHVDEDGGKHENLDADLRGADGTSNGSSRPESDDPLERPDLELENDSEGTGCDETTSSIDESLENLSDTVEQLTRRFDTLEEQLTGESSPCVGALSDLDLTHKILHACLTADHISEEEELRILKAVTTDEFEPT